MPQLTADDMPLLENPVGFEEGVEKTDQTPCFSSKPHAALSKSAILKKSHVIEYVENNIAIFHERRIGSLDRLKLSEVLKRKNPYLFKVKNILSAKKTLRTSNSNLQIICINGCCYGKMKNSDKGSYFKYCGQQFWEYIGGNENIYIDIIEPLECSAKEKNDDFIVKYNAMLNRFTKSFIEEFCLANGDIDWNKIVELNSGKIRERRSY